MIRRPPRSTRTDTLFPYTTLFRSGEQVVLFAFGRPEHRNEIQFAARQPVQGVVPFAEFDPRPEAEVVGDRARERDVETIGVAVLVDELVGRVVRVAADSQGAGYVVAGNRGPGPCPPQQTARPPPAQAPPNSTARAMALTK